jgi:Methyltransferase domain
LLRSIKKMIRGVPVVGPFLVRVRQMGFKNSGDYWEGRYREGGNSGAGSYNRLARFKGDFLNKFVAENQIASVIEFGCGDGSQLKLAEYPSYVGVDVSSKAVEICRAIFSGDTSKRFVQLDELDSNYSAELSLSLDVVYHLVEDPVFEAYMRQLFASARRFVVIYSSDIDEAQVVKHVRQRNFTRWVGENEPDWRLVSTVKNAYPFDVTDPDNTSFADFYVFARR